MDTLQILFLMFTFIAVLSVFFLFLRVVGGSELQNRLRQIKGDTSTEAEGPSELVSSLVKVVDPISKLSLPSDGWEHSPLHLKFLNAGWRGEYTPKLFFGIKTLLTFGLPLLTYLLLDKSIQANSPQHLLFILCLAAAVGYCLPNIYLAKVANSRKQEIVNNLPDATDLLLICVEAGLSFDQALGRVASEIKIKSHVISEEFELVLMEVRSGLNRKHALKNVVLRTGVESVETLANMINQTEKFGTSIGDSLRVYADTERTKRRQHAEEKAAKIAVKLLFPLMFCLFPCMFIVLLVPSLVNLAKFFS